MSNEVVSLRRTARPEARGFREYSVHYAGGLSGGVILLPPAFEPELLEDMLRDVAYGPKENGSGRDS